jgi:hypothetical protein
VLTQEAFCPHCGAKRPEWAKFCGTCGQSYDAPPAAVTTGQGSTKSPPPTPPPAPIPAPPGSAPSDVERPAVPTSVLAGVAWILGAALTGYLGLLQLGYAGTEFDDGSLQFTAIWNLVAAALQLFFGAKLLTKPDRGFLGTSVAWAVLVVAWNGYNIMNGATHFAYIGATVCALAAGVLSWAARSAMPAPPRVDMRWGEPPNDGAS